MLGCLPHLIVRQHTSTCGYHPEADNNNINIDLRPIVAARSQSFAWRMLSGRLPRFRPNNPSASSPILFLI